MLPQANYGTNVILDDVKSEMTRTGHLAQVLIGHNVPRVTFDVENKEHRAVYLAFMETGVWLVKFKLEQPHQTVTQMCERKLLKWALRKDESLKLRLWKKHRPDRS